MDRRADDGQPVSISAQLISAAQDLQQSMEQFIIDAMANGWAQSEIDDVCNSFRQAHTCLLIEAESVDHIGVPYVLH